MFLDEIQECPRAITALKLFQEQMPDIPVIAAGSLLGVALDRGGREGQRAGSVRASWPVGKLSYLDLFPLTFGEFVSAVATPQVASVLESGDLALIDAISERFGSLLREYLYVEGMPEAVSAYQATGDLREARRIQEELLRGYELDFSKHVGSPS